MTTIKPRYTIKQYLLLCVLSVTLGTLASIVMLVILNSILNIGCRGILVVLVIFFPIASFSMLYGFYKGLVKYYGLSGNENLFFGGKF